MDGQPSDKVPTNDNLDLPLPDAPWKVKYWCGNARNRYINRADFRSYEVTRVVRYKKRNGTQHEYLVATVHHPALGNKCLLVERARADLDEGGLPRLLENQQGTPPATPGDDITKGFWARWTESNSVAVIQEPPTKKSSGSLPSKSKLGFADDIVKLWTPPLLTTDRLIDILDLSSDPLPLVHLAILAETVHDNQSLYNLFKSQCYWYSDMISQVIAKSKSIERNAAGENPTTDVDVCYDNIRGTWYHIPVASVQPSVVAHIQAEFERRCSEFGRVATKLIAEMEEEEQTKQKKLSDAMKAEMNRKLDEERAEANRKLDEERAEAKRKLDEEMAEANRKLVEERAEANRKLDEERAEANRKLDEERAEANRKLDEERAEANRKLAEERAKFNEERVAYQAANLKFEAYQRHIQKHEGLA